LTLPLRPATAPDLSPDELGVRLFEAALAGARALMLFWKGPVRASRKRDGSLVSEADHASDAAVRAALRIAGVEAPLVSEEGSPLAGDGSGTYLLLDPLDGTADFLDQAPEFCVCLACIRDHRPIAGAIVAPALRRAWHAGKVCHALTLDEGLAVSRSRKVTARATPTQKPLRGLISRRHGDERSLATTTACGVSATITASSAIKFGLLAEGEADLHVRHGATMGWDIAAGDVILAAAGGAVCGLDGAPLRYPAAAGDYRNPPFIAVRRAALAQQILSVCNR
jgi:3'(2'), 5'-bisphosphate nucleotidase